MDLDKYINDNFDDLILNDVDNQLKVVSNNIIIKNDITEDLEEDLQEDHEDLQEDHDDFYEKLYYKLNSKKNKKNQEENQEETQEENQEENQEEDSEEEMLYYFNLINIFTKYYNEKYDKKDNFFTGIIDKEKDTSILMELFFEAIIEFKTIKNLLKIEDNKILFNYIIQDKEKVAELFDKQFDQVYCLELENKRLCTLSLIVCLNYIYENNLINENWKIFNLKER